MEAWLERCPDCEAYWLEAQDVRTAELLAKKDKVARAYATLSSSERTEFTRELAADAGAAAKELHGPGYGAHLLALLGLPVTLRDEGDRSPWATLGLCAVLMLSHLFAPGSDERGYLVGSPGLAEAFLATFQHAGLMHLLGNLYFLFAFGASLERKLARWAYLLSFPLLGAATTLVEAAVSPDGTRILGASGAVFAVLGASVVLQPKARVLVTLPVVGFFSRVRVAPSVQVPLPLYGFCWLAWNGLMALSGVPGVAWTAHVSGLLLGVAGGFASRWWWSRPS